MTTSISMSSEASEGARSAAPSLADPRRASWWVLVVFLAPALAIYVGLTAYPAFRTFHDSFFTIEGLEASFVGLANYRALLSDETFWVAVRNTFVWSFIAPVLDVATGLLLSIPAVGGVVVGTAIQQRISQRAVSLLFAALLVAIAIELVLS